MIPLGLGLSVLSAAALIAPLPLAAAALAVTLLSLGYDLTQPLLAGIVTTLGRERAGQAMGLNVFLLFMGFGVGSLLFGELLRLGFTIALTSFSLIQLLAAGLALGLFRAEGAPADPSPLSQLAANPLDPPG